MNRCGCRWKSIRLPFLFPERWWNQIWVQLLSSHTGETSRRLLHPSNANPEQEPRHWGTLRERTALPPCASPAQVPTTRAFLWREHFSRLCVSTTSPVYSDGFCLCLMYLPVLPHVPLFKGQMNAGPELNWEKNVILAEMRSNHLMKGIFLGGFFGAPQVPAARVTTAVR